MLWTLSDYTYDYSYKILCIRTYMTYVRTFVCIYACSHINCIINVSFYCALYACIMSGCSQVHPSAYVRFVQRGELIVTKFLYNLKRQSIKQLIARIRIIFNLLLYKHLYGTNVLVEYVLFQLFAVSFLISAHSICPCWSDFAAKSMKNWRSVIHAHCCKHVFCARAVRT